MSLWTVMLRSENLSKLLFIIRKYILYYYYSNKIALHHWHNSMLASLLPHVSVLRHKTLCRGARWGP